jgi:glutathione S-transferase
MKLIIGNKAYSSWSLRGWLAAKQSGLHFEEITIPLYGAEWEETKREMGEIAPSQGRVPVLWDGEAVVWDSLAILEYLAERHPELRLWPRDEEARALARSVSAEMHSGFVTLRNDMSMELLARLPTPPISDELARDISRIVAIWRETRTKHGAGGPFLFGAFSNADAMYAPVATRFRTYGVDLAAFGDDGTAASYAETILALPAMAEWTEGAEAEIMTREAS